MKQPLRSLAARITLLVFLASVLSALTVTWVSVQSLDGFLREKVDQRFPLAASRIAQELDQWYSLRAREIEVFAGSAILIESSPALEKRGRRGDRARTEAEQYLRYVLESFPQYERLVIANTEGRPLIEVGGTTAPPPSLWSTFLPDTEVTSISDALRLDDRLVQIASAPLRDTNGRPMSRLFALIDLDLLEPVLRSKELGDTARVLLVDRDGRFLNPPEDLDPEARFEGPRSLGDEPDGSASAVAYYDGPSRTRVVGTRIDFPRFGWRIVIEQSYDEAFAPVVRSMSRVAALNVAIVLVVGLIAYRIAGSIVKPLRALSDAARRLSEGERAVEIDETGHSSEEVLLLTRTFNEMSRGLARSAIALEENQNAIETANAELVSKNEKLSEMNLVLEQLSITDGLTKLHNHRYFQDSMTRECKRSLRTEEPLCLILIDIDSFKKWNDRLGHAGGDEILRRMADILNQAVRDTDLLARYGGEEFALLAINTDLEGAAALGEKIRQAVEHENFITDVPSERERLTVSIGVAAFHGDRKRLFHDADAALYAAKDGGRNRVVVA